MPAKYAGRRADVYILNFALPKAAGEILDQHAAPRLRTRGQFIARLLFEFQAREEGREEERERLAAKLSDETVTQAPVDVAGCK